MINFDEKHCLPVVTWNKNNLSEQVTPIIYTLEKRFLQLLYFWRFVSCFLSGRVKKLVVYFGLYESSLDLQRREDHINTLFVRIKFIFLNLDSLMSESINLSWKMTVQIAGCVFLANTKIIFGYNLKSKSNQIKIKFKQSPNIKRCMKKWWASWNSSWN